MAAELEEIKDDLGDEPQPKFDKHSITSYPADFEIAELVKRLKEGSIIIPHFQEARVWKNDQASRFIESLLLGLPVPAIFLAREADSDRLLVIDGQQRLETLRRFYDNKFRLTNVQLEFENRQYDDLSLYEHLQLNRTFIPTTIIQSNGSFNDDTFYFLFERLNTERIELNPQEIRSAFYYGSFSKLLDELNTNEYWREIFGRLDNQQMRDTELILRFLALYFDIENYYVPLKAFLNSYMSKNKNLDIYSLDKQKKAFLGTIEVAYEALGKSAFKPKGILNAAIFDAVMVGIAKRLEKGQITHLQEVVENYDELLANNNFNLAVESDTGLLNKIIIRTELATKAFANIL